MTVPSSSRVLLAADEDRDLAAIGALLSLASKQIDK